MGEMGIGKGVDSRNSRDVTNSEIENRIRKVQVQEAINDGQRQTISNINV